MLMQKIHRTQFVMIIEYNDNQKKEELHNEQNGQDLKNVVLGAKKLEKVTGDYAILSEGRKQNYSLIKLGTNYQDML